MEHFRGQDIGRRCEEPDSRRSCSRVRLRIFTIVVSMRLVGFVLFESRKQDLSHGGIAITQVSFRVENRCFRRCKISLFSESGGKHIQHHQVFAPRRRVKLLC